MKNNKEEWFKNESFWLDFAPLMFDSDRLKDTKTDVEGILSMIEKKEYLSVLDTCCGMGRHSLEFAKLGHKVMGIDITAPYLKIARESALNQCLDIDFQQIDIRKFKRESTFDLALNLYTSFGYFDSDEEEELFCKNIHSSLKEGGCFVIETLSKELASRDYSEKVEIFRNDYQIVLRQNFLSNWTRLENNWLFNKNGKKRDFTFSHKVYSAEELAYLLLSTGFSEVTFYGDYDRRLYNQKANTMIAVALK